MYLIIVVSMQQDIAVIINYTVHCKSLTLAGIVACTLSHTDIPSGHHNMQFECLCPLLSEAFPCCHCPSQQHLESPCNFHLVCDKISILTV